MFELHLPGVAAPECVHFFCNAGCSGLCVCHLPRERGGGGGHLLGLRLPQRLEARAVNRQVRLARKVVLAEGAGAHLAPAPRAPPSGRTGRALRKLLENSWQTRGR